MWVVQLYLKEWQCSPIPIASSIFMTNGLPSPTSMWGGSTEDSQYPVQHRNDATRLLKVTFQHRHNATAETGAEMALAAVRCMQSLG
jgi:hypothetical protein